MANEKYMFAAAILIAIAFFGFMMLGSGSAAAQPPVAPGVEGMQIDKSIPVTPQVQQQAQTADAQIVRVRASSQGYDNARPIVKAGQPVRFEFSADRTAGCCAQVIIDGYGVNIVSRNGETVSATFTPKAPGEIKFHCGMNMCRGAIVVQ